MPDVEYDIQWWMRDAACLDSDSEAFFPQVGKNARLAKRICFGSCPVRQQCLDYAMTHNERFGVWGGTSEYERRKVWLEIHRRRRSKGPVAA